ncbi:MAG: glucose-1-phosphate adenylyltransferase [Nitrospinae bacterium]|nr:glucose-1-phosphate adenylyltransferase [Nitrospinota bacterium]
MIDTLAFILAGGKGERLAPLTNRRAKPAVRFGGSYRIIDFTLSNCANSGIRRVIVLPQYQSFSLTQHLLQGWNIFSPEVDEYIYAVVSQKTGEEGWYQSTADAIYQNLAFVTTIAPAAVLVLGGDHIYKMNYADMVQQHLQTGADVTVGAIEIPRAGGQQFGILQIADDGQIVDFEEKPADPMGLPSDPEHAYASMGIYCFQPQVLCSVVMEDAALGGEHDFGRNVIPRMLRRYKVMAYNFKDENKKEPRYWRDVGTVDAYWEANMDLVAVEPLFNLYDLEWPLRTYQGQYPPAKFVWSQEWAGGRLGMAVDSIVSAGCIISGGRVYHSVLSPNVRVHSYAEVRDTILFDRVEVGREARVQRAIVDEGVTIPPGMVVGYDPEEDAKRFHVSDKGIVVVSDL